MKKIFLIVLVALTTLCTFGCENPNDNPNESDLNVEVVEEDMIVEEEKSIILQNKYSKLVINKENGSINSIVNLLTGRDYIQNSAGGNWALSVDLSTNDYYYTNLKSKSTKKINSRSFTPTIEVVETDENAKIILDYNVNVKDGSNNYDGIHVICTIMMEKNNKEVLIDYKVENNLDIPSVIINFTGLIISGLKDEAGTLDLFWPNKEGKIYEAGVKKAFTTLKLSEQYPSPISMQLVQLFDKENSLYYYVKDSSREYKEFNFGAYNASGEYDNGSVTIADKVSLSCTQYPYLAKGEGKELWTTVLGFDYLGEWYTGSDSYRQFLIDSGMSRTYNDYVNEWTGVASTTISGYGNNIRTPYVGTNSPDKVVQKNDSMGVDSIILFGWHEGGFDSMYPDYEFFEGEGYGEENFQKMIDSIHANGDKALPYLNAHIIDVLSKWGNEPVNSTSTLTNLESSALKKMGFNQSTNLEDYGDYWYYETYGTDTIYVSACPGSSSYVEQIVLVADKLASKGVDGFWMDQMMEMPAYLCYDSTHNHKNPATAYAEGYKNLYTSIDAVFKKYGTEYLIFAEGTTDAWIEYIDICSYMWGRKLYAPDTVRPGDGEPMNPNITKYTIPAKFLGIESYDTEYIHAHAFLFGNPILVPEGIDAEIIKLYENNKEIYMYGRYMDTLGLNYANNKVESSVIMSSENSLGIQFYNNSNSETTVFLEIDLYALGIKGEIVSITNMFDNSVVEFNNNKLVLKIAANSPVALKVIYE